MSVASAQRGELSQLWQPTCHRTHLKWRHQRVTPCRDHRRWHIDVFGYDTVQIRRQTIRREMALGTVLNVSGQLEPISANLIPAQAGVKVEMGLPFAVSLPTELALIPGESVDLLFGK